MVRFIAVLFVAGSVASSTSQAQDATIDTLTKTYIGGPMKAWRIDYSGKLTKLPDVGGGYVKWWKIDFKIDQKGTTVKVSTVSVTPPTLTADGSFSATATVNESATPEWTAWAEAAYILNAKGETAYILPKKAFTLP